MENKKYIICVSNINDINDSTFPLTVGKTYKAVDEDSDNYWVEDETGFFDHYWKDLFSVIQ